VRAILVGAARVVTEGAVSEEEGEEDLWCC